MSDLPKAMVLVVEDDPGIAELERNRLEEAGYRAIVAGSADEAVRILRTEGVDLILLDYRLAGGVDGLALYERLRAEGVVPPVILVTGFSDEAVAIRALRAGVRDFVTKSVEYLDYLPEAVGRVLREVETERRLAESEARLAAVIGTAKDAVIVVEADRTVSLFNPAAERMFRRPAAEAMGLPLSRFIPDEPVETPDDPDSEDGGSVTHRMRMGTRGIRGDGAVFPLEASVSRGEVGGRKFYTVVVRDVTERRAMETRLLHVQRMEAVGRLAGGVAHDFNNLLTVINGYGELLLSTIPPADPSWEMVDEMKKAGERAAGLTRQLLAFSRQQVLQPRVLDLNAVVTDLKKFLKRVVGEDIKIMADLAPDLWPVRADPGQIEQVVMNLAVNARDAMPDGGFIRIGTKNVELDAKTAAAHPGATAGKYVQIAVRDTGTGIAEDVSARIFEPFFTTKKPGEGTGLGLSVVHGVVEQSGGFVEVESAPGVGTTFLVYLPAAGGSAIAEMQRQTKNPLPRGTETVLIVEDEPAVRALAARVLKAAGYTVLEAGGATEALGVAGRHQGTIHLLVTDVVMPGLGGRTISEVLQKEYPGLKVLFMSGYTTDTVVRHGVHHDQVPFLQKPFAPPALANKVREVLDGPSTNRP